MKLAGFSGLFSKRAGMKICTRFHLDYRGCALVPMYPLCIPGRSLLQALGGFFENVTAPSGVRQYLKVFNSAGIVLRFNIPVPLTLSTMSAQKHLDPELGGMNVVLSDPITIPQQISGAGFIVNGVALDAIKSQLVSIGEKPYPPPLQKPKQPPHKVSRGIRIALWFNTYRSVLALTVSAPLNLITFDRKFFILTVILNIIGLVLAITNTWSYPRHYTGAFVLGNLLVAILMRNELFGRFLYLIVNTLFAHVRIPY